MDVILKGILDSAHPFELKKALVDNLVIPAAKDSKITHEQCRRILELSLELVLWAQSNAEAEMGFNIFNSCAQSSDLTQFLNENFFQFFISKIPKGYNKCTAAKIIQIALKMRNNFAVEALTRQTSSFIDAKKILSVWEVANLFEEFPGYLLEVTDPTRLIGELVEALANFSPGAPTTKNLPVDIGKLMERICKFCGAVWARVPLRNTVSVFGKVYDLLSSDVKEPAVCLASVTKFVQVEVLEEIIGHLLGKIPDQDGLDLVFTRLLKWLHWPWGENVDFWVVVWMRALANAGKFSVLIRVTNENIEKICLLLQWQIKMSNRTALTVITFMLMSFQNSPVVFHKILPHVPGLIKAMKEMKESEKECGSNALLQFVELLYLQMDKYTGFPELYGPILDTLKGVACELRRNAPMEFVAWDSTREISQSYSGFLPRSQTGKLGLNNLGNTCYMNSVLQALYMTDLFRDSVLSSSPKAARKVRAKLQYVFAFLSHSKRVTYSPKSFHEASKPPWFEPYRQQDCSEFLHHLFDTLHEQETTVDKSPSSPKRAMNEPAVECCTMHEMFGGKLTTLLECLECRTVSEGTESFVDIPLAFPSEGTATNLEDLLGHFFAPEILDGDNRYSCGNCGCLRSAEKRVKVVRSPRYLVMNLMRFGYDAATQRRTKILTDVKYPKVLEFPGDTLEGKLEYKLYAVVVHSGASSDAGHYYTYAWGEDCNWLLFNDSNVTFADFESFQRLSERFPKDTAYLLFYQRVVQAEEGRKEVKVHEDLMEMVERDNVLYMKEEKEAADARRRKDTFAKRDSWRDFDDNPPGSCGSGQNHFARFVF